MTTGSFLQELDGLRKYLEEMGEDVSVMIQRAVEALVNGDEAGAKSVIKADKQINAWENRIVDQAIRLIATNQPVAGDLRFLASSLRLATELERMGDLGANLARRTLGLLELTNSGAKAYELPAEVGVMAQQARDMLQKSLLAFTTLNTELAEEVLSLDDSIDDFNRKIRASILEIISRDGHQAPWGLEIISTAGHLERLGDHSTNLAEEAIFMARGRNIRHNY